MSLAQRISRAPWGSLEAIISRANAHPNGMIDLSMGSPVDDVPELVQTALKQGANSPGYPNGGLGRETNRAIRNWYSLPEQGITLSESQVVPLAGTKETIVLLPTLLSVRAGKTIVVPDPAYPSYVTAAELAGLTVIRANSPEGLPVDGTVGIIYLNSPRNPSGIVMTAAELREWVEWARSNDAILVGDECYDEFVWSGERTSLLSPQVAGGSFERLLVFNSLSKRSNMAGYRAGWVAGDEALIEEVGYVLDQMGASVSSPVQHAMVTALGDQEHVELQRAKYVERGARMSAALVAGGWEVGDFQGGLYLWVSRPGVDAWVAATMFAELGIVVTPGAFYGPGGEGHVRVALTAHDDVITLAVDRLQQR